MSDALLDRAFRGPGPDERPKPTDEEKARAKSEHISLLFGELSRAGVRTALGPDILNASGSARVLLDLGCGFGRLVVQAFVENPNLTLVVGVEYSQVRYDGACTFLFQLCRAMGQCAKAVEHPAFVEVVTHDNRVLRVVHGNMYDCGMLVAQADIVVLQTSVLPESYALAKALLDHSKSSARLLTYQSLTDVYGSARVTRSNKWRYRETVKLGVEWNVNGHQFNIYDRD
jgi:hypothetical protein